MIFNLHTVIWFKLFLFITNNFQTNVFDPEFGPYFFFVQLYGFSNYSYLMIIYMHTVIWFKLFLFITNNFQTNIFDPEFGPYFLCNYMISSNYYYLMIIICWHTVIWFEVFLSNMNSLVKPNWAHGHSAGRLHKPSVPLNSIKPPLRHSWQSSGRRPPCIYSLILPVSINGSRTPLPAKPGYEPKLQARCSFDGGLTR